MLPRIQETGAMHCGGSTRPPDEGRGRPEIFSWMVIRNITNIRGRIPTADPVTKRIWPALQNVMADSGCSVHDGKAAMNQFASCPRLHSFDPPCEPQSCLEHVYSASHHLRIHDGCLCRQLPGLASRCIRISEALNIEDVHGGTAKVGPVPADPASPTIKS
jgi:hypothetical protein